MKRLIEVTEPRGFPEFSEDDWRGVKAWMRDRRIPNLRAFFVYVGRREAMFEAVVETLRKGPL